MSERFEWTMLSRRCHIQMSNTEGVIVMNKPVRAAESPFAIDVEQGKSYFWCACGKSAKQPFCDGSHKDTAFTPVKYEATESKTVYFCGCKETQAVPLCDGSHKKTG
jgi:CDGSH-type Zn-finger protein